MAPKAGPTAVAAPLHTDQHAQLHVSTRQGLGTVGDVSPTHLPWLLRLAHVRSRTTGADSGEALQVRRAESCLQSSATQEASDRTSFRAFQVS